MRPVLEAIARDRLILSGGTSDPKMHSAIGFAGFTDTTRRAETVPGGYRVNGRGGFSTLCACADILGETAHYDDPQQGPQCLFFSRPRTPRVSRSRTTGTR
jgi:alkylation response protein AidB-like acyl-CoA dehydrogenase